MAQNSRQAEPGLRLLIEGTRLSRKSTQGNQSGGRVGIEGALAALAFLVVLLCLLLHESIFQDKGLSSASGIFSFSPWKSDTRMSPSNPLLADQFLRMIPVRNWLQVNIQDWNLPLWNPFLSCGAPALAAMQNAALFPIHLALSFLDPFHTGTAVAFVKLRLRSSK